MYTTFQVDESVDRQYIAYLLKSPDLVAQYSLIGQGSINRRKSVAFSSLAELEAFVPPLPEQKKIAEILSGIDNHIDGIKKQITALVLLRSSILEQSLKRFADCAVRPLHEITERITVGIVSKPADHYVSKGVPTLRSMNIKEGRIDYRDIRFISKESNEAFKKSMIKKGDILTVRTGAPGTSAVAPADLEGANCVDIILSTPAPGIDSFFLCLQINSASIKSKVFTAQGGLAQQHFNVGEMRDLEVLVPPLEIQRDISCSVNSVKACIDSKDRHKVKLEELKRAMSDDLLSGRKRVSL
jgi:type I restriction enzyme S subunit